MKKIYTLLLLCAISTSAFNQGSWIWLKTEAPVLTAGSSGSWDDQAVGFPCVLQIGQSYHMWYAGISSAGGMEIGHATSDDGINWIKDPANPVLKKGEPGEWDESLVYIPKVIYKDGAYHMWFTGGDVNVNEHLGYATSDDGKVWTKYEGNPVGKVGEASDWDYGDLGNGGIYCDGEKFHFWYNGTGAVGYATSEDGSAWIREVDYKLMEVDGNWDSPRLQPNCVVANENGFDMYYSGGGFYSWRIGHATSGDGLDWIRDENNPVIDTGSTGSFDHAFVAFPYVIRDAVDSKLKMWYYGGNETYGGEIFYAEYTEQTGIANPGKREAKITVYPNPASGNISIATSMQGLKELAVINLSGQVVYQETINGENAELDVGSLPAGMYFISLSSGIHVVTKKLILR